MRIGIIGAGIGGLVAAAGLQADGHDVTVYERRDAPAAVGAGLTLFVNAFAALDAIGLGDTVRAVSADALGRMRSGQRRPSGRWLVSVPPGSGPAVRSLHRAELHSALLARLPAGMVRAGSTAQADPGGAPVVTVDGALERFDLVVAADGIRSGARRTWGLDRGVRYAGYTAWRGVTASRGHLADEAGEAWGAGARFGIVPLPDDRVYWFAVLTAAEGADFGDEPAMLRERFGGWHAPIPALLDATPTSALLRHDIHDLAALPPRCVAGRGVLLGDAAHAMTPDLGQGAGQAIEDAATLVLLLRHAGAPDAALREYDRLRRRRARTLWHGSRLAGRVAQASSPAAVATRDVLMRAMPAGAAVRAAARVARWQEPQGVSPGESR
ncbi:FAD-dependent monooxygenase [Tomitella fengzijianii]|uniref:FAD-dependent monooxygenase n=1 Tax=Tomitella fengzijianii TaxID=2597660 RepID=UPI00131B2E7C|nr:FAD-dependent monooxygenase [Tomitella fengzijianii]